jgi:hypothetical protein
MNVFDYIGLYFFSAVFQGNMALLALLGVFMVFKQQVITTDLREQENEIIAFLQKYCEIYTSTSRPPGSLLFLLPFSYKRVEDIPNIMKEMASRKDQSWLTGLANGLLQNDEYKYRFENLEEISRKSKNIINHLKRPFISFLIVIILSLVLLPLIPLIHKASICFEILMIVCTFIINIWVLVETTRFVWIMLKD